MIAGGVLDAQARAMPTSAIEIQRRTSSLLSGLKALLASVGGGERGGKIASGMVQACEQMDVGYRHACASASPGQFLARISHVARNAKRTKATLMLLTQLDYLSISQSRDLLFEARGLETIFRTARDSARRRYFEPGPSRKNPSTRGVQRSGKSIPEGQKSAWSHEVGPQTSSDKPS